MNQAAECVFNLIDEMNLKMKSGKIIFLLVLSAIFSCQPKIHVPAETEIIELWDNGQARLIMHYEIMHGKKVATKEVHYHANGVKSMEGPLQNGLRNGEWKSWYDDGALWSVGSFKNGKREGKGLVFHANGKKFIEGSYLSGERIGKWSWWDEDGNSLTEAEAMKKITKAQPE